MGDDDLPISIISIPVLSSNPTKPPLKVEIQCCPECYPKEKTAFVHRSNSGTQCQVCPLIKQILDSKDIGNGRLYKKDIYLQYGFEESPCSGNKFHYCSLRAIRETELELMPSKLGCSALSIKKAASWLYECTHADSDHANCSLPSSVYLPTRLLEINGSISNLSVRLREKDECIIAGNQHHYAALSHCWGPPGSPRLELTLENYDRYKSDITWTDIPRTFQDAIVFTRQLGVQYIWIDSLCIIQHEPGLADWRREAAQMVNVYSNAYFTIMALNSADDGVGLFQKIPKRYTPASTVIRDVDNETTVLCAQVVEDHALTQFTDSHVRSYPLLQRAWAYQERYLSPRRFVFTESEITWVCISTAHFERSKVSSDAKESLVGHWNIAASFGVRREIRSVWQWQHLVEDYSLLTLTFEKDKLPAIGGVAASLSSHYKIEYYAGIWGDNVLHFLSWRHSGPGSRPAQYRAPSWSWASTEGAIEWTYPTDSNVPIAEVKHISCDLVGTDSFGEVSGSRLVLKAPSFLSSKMRTIMVKLLESFTLSFLDANLRCRLYIDDQRHKETFLQQESYFVQLKAHKTARFHLMVLRRVQEFGVDASEEIFERVGYAEFIRYDPKYSSSEPAVSDIPFPESEPARIFTIV